jgi:hypothetical protein
MGTLRTAVSHPWGRKKKKDAAPPTKLANSNTTITKLLRDPALMHGRRPKLR